MRRRLDAEVVRRDLLPDIESADAHIVVGRVTVNGATADNPSRMVLPGDAVILLEAPARFVSRGGEKLDRALDEFDVSTAGVRALDAGASTGGFTDCLLQRGAAHVVALDVGHGQLHPTIRDDERVTVFERTHVRDASVDLLGGPVDVVVADLSFISLRSVAGPLVAACAPTAELVVLVKPQFEADRVTASRGDGVITDPGVWKGALSEVIDAFEREGATIMGAIASPIRGARGNVEFLVHIHVGPAEVPAPTVDLDELTQAASGLVDRSDG